MLKTTRGMSDSYSLPSSASTEGPCLFCNQVSSFLFAVVAVSRTCFYWAHRKKNIQHVKHEQNSKYFNNSGTW